jgi:hypothetical protein
VRPSKRHEANGELNETEQSATNLSVHQPTVSFPTKKLVPPETPACGVPTPASIAILVPEAEGLVTMNTPAPRAVPPEYDGSSRKDRRSRSRANLVMK